MRFQLEADETANDLGQFFGSEPKKRSNTTIVLAIA